MLERNALYLQQGDCFIYIRIYVCVYLLWQALVISGKSHL